MSQIPEFIQSRQAVNFLDLFAGAGGISEGFIQAYTPDKYFNFVLASDINENCELTHLVRYNAQLGLDTQFLKEDIMSETFLQDLKTRIGDTPIDVITGGPSCQSFSLSGRRRKYDKRDNLFEHYLNVISSIRPKYFVMENVKGILTKDSGHFKDEILRRIRSIVDTNEVPALLSYLEAMLSRIASPFEKNCILCKVKMETSDSEQERTLSANYISALEEYFKELTRGIDYIISKSNRNISTIRHGLNLLQHNDERSKIKKLIVQEKASSDIDNDAFVNPMNEFIESLEDDSIISKITAAIDAIPEFGKFVEKVTAFKSMLGLYSLSLDEALENIEGYAEKDGSKNEFDRKIEELRLYRIDRPIVVLSSDYGVPQNRERVLFIGCRKDQKLITEIPPTISEKEKATVYEAISDLDFIGNGETKTDYEKPQINKELSHLIRHRSITGSTAPTSESHTFSQWSRIGRLEHRFKFDCDPFYVKTMEDLKNPLAHQKMKLFNHQTSTQNETVRKRLSIITKHGDYDDACKEELKKEHLESNKRNYTLLRPDGQSPTVVTIPDDFIHYSQPRPTTVREMARLQSFDDSFVFQGKRHTGGDKRKSEIPQYTLVGNAVPPLMARAIANKILSVIH